MDARMQTNWVEPVRVGVQTKGLGVMSPIEAIEQLDWLDMNDTVSDTSSEFEIKNLEESLKFPESSYTLGVVISNEDDGRPEYKSFDNIVPVEPAVKSFDNIVPVEPVLKSFDNIVPVEPVIKSFNDIVPVEPVLKSFDNIVPVEPVLKSFNRMSLMESTEYSYDYQVQKTHILFWML